MEGIVLSPDYYFTIKLRVCLYVYITEENGLMMQIVITYRHNRDHTRETIDIFTDWLTRPDGNGSAASTYSIPQCMKCWSWAHVMIYTLQMGKLFTVCTKEESDTWSFLLSCSLIQELYTMFHCIIILYRSGCISIYKNCMQYSYRKIYWGFVFEPQKSFLQQKWC